MPAADLHYFRINPTILNRFEEWLNNISIFSPEYQQILSGDYPRASKGKPCFYGAKTVKDPSYSKIGTETTIYNDDITVKALIHDNSVILDISGITYPVISAPSRFNKNQKIKFCKAVVRTFIDDPDNIMDYINRASKQYSQFNIPEGITA